MKVGDVYQSNFIKANREGQIEVPGRPYDIVVTIEGTDVTTFQAERPGEKPKQQITLSFVEIPKMTLGLNVTNVRAITTLLGSDETDDWIGKQIELCTVPEDKSQTGHAIRVRKPRTRAQAGLPVAKPLGVAGANKLSARLSSEGRAESDLRTHLKHKFPQYAAVLAGDIPNWPLEVGQAIAAWFATPFPATETVPPEDDSIPF